MAKKEKDINAIKSSRIDSRPFSEISEYKVLRRSKKKKRINRSRGGDIALFVFLCLFGCFSALPLILTVSNAFKPLDEIFLYPPRFFVQNPTLDNFSDLVNALGSSLVPFSRYFFNTIMVTIVGTFGHIIIASMCAYPLAKYKVPGGAIITGLVVYSLMFPASVTYSSDLHSLGQFVQDGSPIRFETIVRATNPDPNSPKLPFDTANGDGLNFLTGATMDEINDKAMMGTLLAHRDGGTDSAIIDFGGKDAYSLGELIYFFFAACAISGYILGVNPFDQPGVEAYKKNMFALLGKPGYEDGKEALLEKIKTI